jgi:hypothetical protein
MWIDRIEKVGRIVLWLSLASACILAPIEYVRLHMAEAESRDALKRAEDAMKADAEKAEKAAHEPHRIAIASMGMYLSAVNPNAPGEQGKLWLTNVSPRSGVLCVSGVATNRTSKLSATSLPTCAKIEPYSSSHVEIMFASGDLLAACPKQGDCELSVRDVPDAKEVALASAQ